LITKGENVSKKLIFLIDFDITISKRDSTDTLLSVYQPELKEDIRKKYRSGEITMKEYLQTGIESLNITKEEFLETLKLVGIDETFVDFVKSGIKFRIVSAGTKLNIAGVLRNYGIDLNEDEIISNDIKFDENKITVSFPYLDKEQYYGVDKKEAVQKYKDEGYTVYFVGDGPSDYRAIEVADFSFVRKGTRAIKFCEENEIDFFEFENFDDGIYYIKYNENNEIIAGKIPKDFDLTLAFSIEDINTYQIENKKFLYYDTRLKNTGDWIRGIYPLSRFQNDISKMWDIVFYYIAPLFIAFVAFVGYKIVKNAFKPVKKISETALEIKKSKNFSRRIDLDYGEDEIHKMASTFNEMLDTVEEVFIHEKQFSSDVSHELRTPITVILAQSDYALDYVETLDEAKESFEVINRQAKKMTNLINQIMELSKMERQNEIEKDKINFSNIILQLLEDYRTLLENNNIELITNIEKDLRIYGNRLMLERLFINLFTNAMKFTKSTINISLNRINKEVILQIKDDGVGIAKKDQKYIWDRFFQTSDSRNKDKNKGSGLGLSMVNRIVQLHSATIEVESEVGEGACFIVKFPI